MSTPPTELPKMEYVRFGKTGLKVNYHLGKNEHFQLTLDLLSRYLKFVSAVCRMDHQIGVLGSRVKRNPLNR